MAMQQQAPQQGAMAGAVQRATGAPGGMPGPMAPPVEEPVAEAGQKEQEAYERTVIAAQKILYNDKAGDALMKMVQSADSPEDGIAEAATTVVLQVDEASGMQVPEDMILPVAEEVVAELVDMTKEAGIADIDTPTAERIYATVTTNLMQAYGTDEEEMLGVLNSIGEGNVQSILQDMGERGVFPK